MDPNSSQNQTVPQNNQLPPLPNSGEIPRNFAVTNKTELKQIPNSVSNIQPTINQPKMQSVEEQLAGLKDTKEQVDYYALASTGIGVFALLSSLAPACGVLFAMIGTVLGVIGRKSAKYQTMAKLGIMFNVLGALFALIFNFLR